jgi:hypothetical protein
MSAVYFYASGLGIFSLKFGKNQGFLALGMVLFTGTTYTYKEKNRCYRYSTRKGKQRGAQKSLLLVLYTKGQAVWSTLKYGKLRGDRGDICFKTKTIF